MKKLISLLAVVLLSSITTAQSVINGKSLITTEETETYTIDKDNAQCPDCHLWITVGGNSQIEGDFRKNSIKLKPNAGGRTVLSLSLLTPQGLSQCSKNIDIVDKSPASVVANTLQKVDCDIMVNSFRDVKYAEGIVTFFPSEIQNNFGYT